MNTQIIRPPTPIKPGMMMQWPTNTAPPGWLLCYGQAISRSGYSGLFDAIGTTFGVGDGSTTFNLPDYRGRMPLGKDNMGGASANRVTNAQADSIGGNSGDEKHTLIAGEMPAHTHTGPSHTHTGPSHTHDSPVETSDGSTGNTGNIGNGNNVPMKTGGSGTGNTGSGGTGATGSAGSGNTHNNMSPYLTVNYIIKM